MIHEIISESYQGRCSISGSDRTLLRFTWLVPVCRKNFLLTSRNMFHISAPINEVFYFLVSTFLLDKSQNIIMIFHQSEHGLIPREKSLCFLWYSLLLYQNYVRSRVYNTCRRAFILLKISTMKAWHYRQVSWNKYHRKVYIREFHCTSKFTCTYHCRVRFGIIRNPLKSSRQRT